MISTFIRQIFHYYISLLGSSTWQKKTTTKVKQINLHKVAQQKDFQTHSGSVGIADTRNLPVFIGIVRLFA
jgi:uncharacterized membrane protein